MAVTSPDNLWSPDSTDPYNLVPDLAAMQDTTQDAITSIRSGIGARRGTNAQRDASTPSAGDRWISTTDGYEYRYSGSTWFLAPGQVLASMIGPTTNTSGAAGTLVGTIISTPVLPIGQKLKIFSRFSSFNGGGQVSIIDTSWRNNASDVTNAARSGFTTSRCHTSTSGTVGTPGGCAATYTTTVAAKVSAGIFLSDATSSVFGADGTHLWIETA